MNASRGTGRKGAARPARRPMRLTVASSVPSRVRGLLRRPPDGGALLLVPCKDIHTVGMSRPIDVAFIDADGLVVEAHRALPPFRRRRCAAAVAVVERYSVCDSPWFSVGDHVGMTLLQGGRE